MASASSFSSLQSALDTANNVWFNKLNVHSWLIALNANINICEKLPLTYASHTNASRTDTYSILEEIYKLSIQYLTKFGFPYIKETSYLDIDTILLDLKPIFYHRVPERQVLIHISGVDALSIVAASSSAKTVHRPAVAALNDTAASLVAALVTSAAPTRRPPSPPASARRPSRRRSPAPCTPPALLYNNSNLCSRQLLSTGKIRCRAFVSAVRPCSLQPSLSLHVRR
ncbi:hypothetical protein PIB30_087703 [Stylosanthes scabra]|uniref:Uncharacterized protein n=1 Tax=Stylosanthes scabra TaxID=79078 RepID=A0ABU6YSI5_9FABA|nr:hypothetical protein [Stylosanthes scabra]